MKKRQRGNQIDPPGERNKGDVHKVRARYQIPFPGRFVRNYKNEKTDLLGGDPLFLGKTLVQDGLLYGGPDSEGAVVLLTLG